MFYFFGDCVNNVFVFSQTTEPLDSDHMAREFLMQFAAMVLTEGQELVFKYVEKNKSENPDKPGKEHQLKLVVKSLEGAVIGQKTQKVITFSKWVIYNF